MVTNFSVTGVTKENFTRQKGENTLLVSNMEILMQIIDYVCATRVEEPMKQSKDWLKTERIRCCAKGSRKTNGNDVPRTWKPR